MKKKAILVILDGWGIGDGSAADALAQTATPCFDRLMATHPHSTLVTYGEDVGLPEGQMGNSEVGHLNIGAGRVVYQDLVRINRAIADQSIDQNPVLVQAFQYAAQKGVAVHLMGLLSDGGVHSSQHHLHHLCDMADAHQLSRVFVHAFTDGRDTDPKGGVQYLQKLEQHLDGKSARLASVIGRYYAMDRDNRWERVREAYDLLVHGKGTSAEDLVAAVAASYEDGVTDEFIRPLVGVDATGQPIVRVQPDDVVICFNFRTDRCREITMALTQQPFPEHAMAPLPLHYVTFTNYDQNFRDVHVVFTKDNLQQTLGETLAQRGKTQVRIAETEKYPHVTFFFSGGREAPFEGESRLLIHSPKVATYDLQPEMSAPEITARIVARLHEQTADFVCLNFANPDMVGHTGVFTAVQQAVATIDDCLNQVVEAGCENGYAIVIIADHGNADYMVNPDGSPNTAHTKNLVPCIVIDDAVNSLRDGILADVAPTILALMDEEKPEAMTGRSLIG